MRLRSRLALVVVLAALTGIVALGVRSFRLRLDGASLEWKRHQPGGVGLHTRTDDGKIVLLANAEKARRAHWLDLATGREIRTASAPLLCPSYRSLATGVWRENEASVMSAQSVLSRKLEGGKPEARFCGLVHGAIMGVTPENIEIVPFPNGKEQIVESPVDLHPPSTRPATEQIYVGCGEAAATGGDVGRNGVCRVGVDGQVVRQVTAPVADFVVVGDDLIVASGESVWRQAGPNALQWRRAFQKRRTPLWLKVSRHYVAIRHLDDQISVLSAEAGSRVAEVRARGPFSVGAWLLAFQGDDEWIHAVNLRNGIQSRLALPPLSYSFEGGWGHHALDVFVSEPYVLVAASDAVYAIRVAQRMDGQRPPS